VSILSVMTQFSRIQNYTGSVGMSEMAKCPHCGERITPKRDCSTTPDGSGDGISGGTRVCPECETILGISEVDFSNQCSEASAEKYSLFCRRLLIE
jgi:DNA-directed RNA polymerase subunit RPC12/RpoP